VSGNFVFGICAYVSVIKSSIEEQLRLENLFARLCDYCENMLVIVRRSLNNAKTRDYDKVLREELDIGLCPVFGSFTPDVDPHTPLVRILLGSRQGASLRKGTRQ
jgi:hypothetical protein